MNLNKILIIGVLGVLFLSSYELQVQAANVKKESSIELINRKEFLDLISDKKIEVPVVHEKWNSRNPFDISAFEYAKPGEKPSFVLQGIFLGSQKPSVIINGKVAALGSKTSEFTVKEIKENKVTLVDPSGNKTVLFLNNQ